MKKLYYIFLLPALVLLASITACGDYDLDDVSSLHILTDEEIETIRIQDSINNALMQTINADLILEYTVTDYISSSTWTYTSFEIDLDAIGECFGLTAQEVADGINQADGAPSITGFAIQASTHQDYTLYGSTTNGTWGHWFDVNGDAGLYSELESLGTIAFYCEWQGDPDTDSNYFNIGQYPGQTTEPTTWTVYECLSYENKRVAVAITYILTERGDVTASVVDTKELTVTMPPFSDWDAVTVEIDMDDIMNTLGVSSPTELSLLGINADGSYQQESTANSGFWYNTDGYTDSYNDTTSAFYIEYYGNDAANIAEYPEDVYLLYIGQYPGHLESGYTADAQFGFMANNKIVMLTVHIVIE